MGTVLILLCLLLMGVLAYVRNEHILHLEAKTMGNKTGTHYTTPPSEPGTYCVKWVGWNTFLPVYMEWDGKAWKDLDAKRYHYFAGVEPTKMPGEFYWFPNG